MFEAIAFYLFAILTIVMFCIVVMTKHPLYALTALGAGMILIAGFFFMLDADFLAVVQIIVYTGAIMALYAFGMMFFDTTRKIAEPKHRSPFVGTMAVITAILLIVIFTGVIYSGSIQPLYPSIAGATNSQSIGMVLFTKYLVPFELAAIMLLVAMVAGIVLAGKKMDQSLTLMAEEEILLIEEAKKRVLL
jgi:NADH-quinone oxidoreductase subunit J